MFLICLLSAVALAGPVEAPADDAPPTSDDPKTRQWDWREVHSRSLNTAHAAQVWGAAGAVGIGVGVFFTVHDVGDLGGIGKPDEWTTQVLPLVLGSTVTSASSAALAGAALRARYATRELGQDASPWPGVAACGFAGASGAALVVWAATDRDGRAMPVVASVTSVGAWTAGTIQLALDKQAQGLLVVPTPGGVAVGGTF